MALAGGGGGGSRNLTETATPKQPSGKNSNAWRVQTQTVKKKYGG